MKPPTQLRQSDLALQPAGATNFSPANRVLIERVRRLVFKPHSAGDGTEFWRSKPLEHTLGSPGSALYNDDRRNGS